MQQNLARRAAQKGLTLIELLVVIAILAILSGIVAYNVLPQIDNSRIKATKVQVNYIKGALQQYAIDMGRVPTQDQGLEALVRQPTNSSGFGSYRPGGYLDSQEVPMDQWGNPYQYAVPGAENAPFDVYSMGPDGRPNTEDDIGSWQQ